MRSSEPVLLSELTAQCVSHYTIRVSAAEREFPLSVQSRSSTDLGGSGSGPSPHLHFLTRRKFEFRGEEGEKHMRRTRTLN